MAHHVDDIHRQVRVYISVFAALAALTGVTVGISYLHLSTPAAMAFAMSVAVVKGSLVALYFMHLVNEQRVVYWLLGLTAIFFAAVLYLPGSWTTGDMRTHTLWDKLPREGRLPHAADQAAADRRPGEDARHDAGSP